ncbi:MAG TPA: hypothetical protein VFV34_22755 [Blastocatellia bacterium]|nr:hypothetical protein [Blastocatellia bacterium]
MQFNKWIGILGIGLLLALSGVGVLAQSDPVSGNYEGIAKSAAIGDIPVKVSIKNDAGKLSGSIDTPQGALPITSGTFADGKISLKFDAGGNEGTVTAQIKEGGKIVGEWSFSGQTGTIDLKRAGDTVAKAAETPKAETPKTGESKGDAKAAPAGDPISGEWAATADTPGGAVQFTLKLKLDSDKVTGEATSDMGTVPLSKGSWTGGKLTILLETPNGNVTLNGGLQEGKLAGEFDFAGQATGKWEAKKK